MLLLRRLKRELFMKNSLRKYVAYGFGELLLVILGILVALQIDNWNEDRKERAMLHSYLESIARNMREDLAELDSLRETRLQARFAAARYDELRNRNRFDVDEIFFLNQVTSLSTSEVFFSANTSGFEALKNSGVLDRLQGSSVEHLLSAYYDKVNQIGLLEGSLYDQIRPISVALKREQPRDLEVYAVVNPQALSAEQFQKLQPQYSRLVNSPMMAALVETQFDIHKLLLYYDSLRVLGEAFIEAVETGQADRSEDVPRTPLDKWTAKMGLPDIVTDGRPALEAYWLGNASPLGRRVFRFDSIVMAPHELQVDFPGGADWAAVYWSPMNVDRGRSNMDFSAFDKLHLELKGARGGEVVTVHVKDADYPDDRPPIGVGLTLSNDWQSYEIDLSEFEPNDLSRLHVVLGFLIYPARDPLAFSVRTARFE